MSRCFIKSQALKNKVKALKNNEKEIKELFDKQKKRIILDTEDIQNFVLTLNNCFVGGVLENLLINSQNIYNQLQEGVND
jgi:hypothetical protein